MIYEERIYTVSDGRMPELIERFEKYTLRLFREYDIKPIIFGISKEDRNKFFYILEFSDMKHFKKSWDGFIQDNKRIEIWEESNSKGKLVTDMQSTIYDSVLRNIDNEK